MGFRWVEILYPGFYFKDCWGRDGCVAAGALQLAGTVVPDGTRLPAPNVSLGQSWVRLGWVLGSLLCQGQGTTTPLACHPQIQFPQDGLWHVPAPQGTPASWEPQHHRLVPSKPTLPPGALRGNLDPALPDPAEMLLSSSSVFSASRAHPQAGMAKGWTHPHRAPFSVEDEARRGAMQDRTQRWRTLGAAGSHPHPGWAKGLPTPKRGFVRGPHQPAAVLGLSWYGAARRGLVSRCVSDDIRGVRWGHAQGMGMSARQRADNSLPSRVDSLKPDKCEGPNSLWRWWYIRRRRICKERNQERKRVLSLKEMIVVFF